VAGLDNYSLPQPQFTVRPADAQPEATTGSCPDASFCGSDMRGAYVTGISLAGTRQSLGLVEFYGTDLEDLDTYFTNAKQINHVPITLLSVDGASTSCLASEGCDDTEQTLDMTQAIGMAPGLASLVAYFGSNDADIFNAMATADPLNYQLSCSWSWQPVDPTSNDPYFEEFAAQGQNLFVAAGDYGSWQTSWPAHAAYPAEDAYVTAVGGTDLTTVAPGGQWKTETAWSNGGGGVSPDNIAIPSWQTAAAAGCSYCSTTLRNAPDVAANANTTFYVCADQSGPYLNGTYSQCTANEFGGTSFAAPMWAGYLALVNQQAIIQSGKPVGFINPELYTIGLSSSYKSEFHDITSGSNGYPATTGYDLVTGWGSPTINLIIKLDETLK
jgi:subtilase family serine protease